MRILLKITVRSLGALLNLTMVLALTVYVFAIAGNNMFQDDYVNSDLRGTEGERLVTESKKEKERKK